MSEWPWYRSTSGSLGAGLTVALIGMAVLSLAADERLIDLYNAAQLGFRLDQGGADFVGFRFGQNRLDHGQTLAFAN